MTTTVLENPPQSPAKHTMVDALVPKWVRSPLEATKAGRSEDAATVWIITNQTLAACVAHVAAVINPYRKAGYLLLHLDARSALLPPLAKRFRAVAWVRKALPKEELVTVLGLADRQDRFIGGIIDEDSKTLTLWRGNFKSVVVPFEAFPATGNGIRPQFNKFSVTDYGRTLKFGDYESTADVVLFEYAPDFRQRLKKTRFAQEQTLGASIRRLRKHRRLTLNDFGDLDPKTLTRIEYGRVRPRRETLSQIAKILRVPREELASY
jgi:DNA-binding XRE family transcriptional regulator